MWAFVFSALSKAVGAGINYAESRRQGSIYAKQGELERELFGKNADLADQQALDAEARGQDAANRQSYRMRTTLGAQNAGFAGQGVSLDSGAPASVIRSDQALGEADRLNILENARREAWGYRQQASGYRMQGDWAYQAGRNKQRSANLNAIGSLVNFGGDMFDMYKGYKS